MASGVHVMEKPIQLQHQHQPHEPLKCPRCDSSNTKFCYYNNYSLSQPRHFCKACKRYWTRGGTLRNVPVGGGCRKNKRVKRPVAATSHGGGGAPTPPITPSHHHTNPSLNLTPNPNLDLASTTSNNNTNNPHLNSLFYGLLPQNPNYNPRFDARVSGYDLLQPHMNATGLGFPGANSLHGQNSCLTTPFSSFNTTSMYGGGNSTGTMASLLASSLNQQQRFMGFASYDDSSMAKDLKMEGSTQNRMDQWSNNNNSNFHGQNDHKDHDQIEGVNVVSSDPNNPLLWDTTTSGDGGGWLDHDPTTTNIGSSVPSLI